MRRFWLIALVVLLVLSQCSAADKVRVIHDCKVFTGFNVTTNFQGAGKPKTKKTRVAAAETVQVAPGPVKVDAEPAKAAAAQPVEVPVAEPVVMAKAAPTPVDYKLIDPGQVNVHRGSIVSIDRLCSL